MTGWPITAKLVIIAAPAGITTPVLNATSVNIGATAEHVKSATEYHIAPDNTLLKIFPFPTHTISSII